MSLLFVDSFDHYATSDLVSKYDLASGATVLTTDPRNGLQHINFSTSSGNLIKIFLSNTTWIVGIAIKLQGNPTGGPHDILEINDDNEDSVNDTQVSLQYTSAQKFRVVRGNEVVGTQLAISDATFDLTDAWHYLEFKVTINNSTGSIDAQFDGTQIAGIATTGIDTQNSANSSATGCTIRSLTVSGNTFTYYDDFYIANGASPGVQAMLGDMKIDALFPKADGNYEEFITSSGTDSFSLVNELPPTTDDSTYVESNVVSEKDSFSMDEAGNFVIHGVQHTLYIRKTDVNRRKIKHLARISGSDFRGDLVRMGDKYTMKTKMWETSPKTGSLWTPGEVNGSEFGMEVNS